MRILTLPLCLTLVCFSPRVVSQDITSSFVFDPVFYLNNHPDLEEAGIDTVDEARQHWIDDGCAEGRQATSLFHSRQYLDLYEDLQAVFGDDFYLATQHYITDGIAEGRMGYNPTGGYGRYTVQNTASGIHVSTSHRTAGAVDSLVWNNKEFINSYDHGRQFQVALTTPHYGECWNPTEAGGSMDDTGMETKSILQGLVVTGSSLLTENHPAYWLRAGQEASVESGSSCTVGTIAVNTVDTHPFPMSKTVTIGAHGMDNCIFWSMSANIGEPLPANYEFVQLEGPTAYLMSDFSKWYLFDPATGEVIPQENQDDFVGEYDLPVIIATEDDHFALGGYTAEILPDLPIGVPGVRYGYFALTPNANYAQKTFKWSIVFREEPKDPNTVISYESYACVGDLAMVTSCMNTLANL